MGQAKKKRECPAVGRMISAGECGANRNSVYNCPEHCDFNPYAPINYDHVLELSDEAEKIVFKYVSSVPSLEQKIAVAGRKGGEEFEAELISLLNATEFKQGMTLLEWIANDPGNGMKNDLRIQMMGRRDMRFTLIEVMEVDEGKFEAFDLLRQDLGKITIMDRQFSKTVKRFDLLLSYLIPMPLYFRVFGANYKLPDVGIDHAPETLFHIIVRHLGWDSSGDMELNRWCLKNAQRIKMAFQSLADRYRKAQFEATDAGVFESVFELKMNPESCFEKLLVRDEVERIESDEVCVNSALVGKVVWCAPSKTREKEFMGRDKSIVWGEIEVSREGLLKICASSRERMVWLTEAVQAHLRGKLVFVNSMENDEAMQVAEKIEVRHPELIPDELITSVKGLHLESQRFRPSVGDEREPERVMADSIENYYREYLDQPHQWLDGKTPREAAQDLFLRPRLLRLVKGLIKTVDELNHRKGCAVAIDWIFDELGLDEIRCSAPKVEKDIDDGPSEMDSNFDEESMVYWEQRVSAMLETGVDKPHGIMPKVLWDELNLMLDAILEFLGVDVQSDECGFFLMLCVSIWRVMLGGSNEATIEEQDIETELGFLYDSLNQQPENQSFENLYDLCDEPELLFLLQDGFIQVIENSDLSNKPGMALKCLIASVFCINLLSAETLFTNEELSI